MAIRTTHRRKKGVNVEEIYQGFKIHLEKMTGNFVAKDSDGNEVESDPLYNNLIKKLDKRKKHQIKPFSAWRLTYKRILPTKVTSIASTSLGYMGHYEIWHSDESGRGKGSADTVFLPTDENMPIISELKKIDQEIAQLEAKRDELMKQKLRSLRDMVADKDCQHPVAVQIRRFLGI
jgi:flagellar biosynthesis chaperone FliJ